MYVTGGINVVVTGCVVVVTPDVATQGTPYLEAVIVPTIESEGTWWPIAAFHSWRVMIPS